MFDQVLNTHTLYTVQLGLPSKMIDGFRNNFIYGDLYVHNLLNSLLYDLKKMITFMY